MPCRRRLDGLQRLQRGLTAGQWREVLNDTGDPAQVGQRGEVMRAMQGGPCGQPEAKHHRPRRYLRGWALSHSTKMSERSASAMRRTARW